MKILTIDKLDDHIDSVDSAADLDISSGAVCVEKCRTLKRLCLEFVDLHRNQGRDLQSGQLSRQRQGWQE
jgi:hypothetical protein